MDLNELQKLNQLARQEGASYQHKRWLYDILESHSGKAFLGIVGARGSGKSVLLKQLAAEKHHAFYVSLDSVPRFDLFELAEKLATTYRINLLLIDEAHYCEDVYGALKKIYDFFSLRVVFTSSVALLMQESTYDLSRRVRLLPLSVLSFREYLLFKEGEAFDVLSLSDILADKIGGRYLQFEYLFEEYLKGKLLPFALQEEDYLPLLRNIVAKVIEKDIPSVQDLRTSEIDTIKRVLEFIGKSAVDGINPSSISRNVGVTKYKAVQYLDLLERSFIVKQLGARGTNVLKEPKVLMIPPYRLLYQDYDQAIGGLREDFVAEMLHLSGQTVYYLKNKLGKKCPDFLLDGLKEKIVIEVGGAGKGADQFKGISGSFRKVIFQPHPGTLESSRPLSSLGFLY